MGRDSLVTGKILYFVVVRIRLGRIGCVMGQKIVVKALVLENKMAGSLHTLKATRRETFHGFRFSAAASSYGMAFFALSSKTAY